MALLPAAQPAGELDIGTFPNDLGQQPGRDGGLPAAPRAPPERDPRTSSFPPSIGSNDREQEQQRRHRGAETEHKAVAKAPQHSRPPPCGQRVDPHARPPDSEDSREQRGDRHYQRPVAPERFRRQSSELTGEGRGDLAAVAQGFGLKGARVNTMARFESLFREHQEAGGTTLWDVHIDDLIPSRQFRRVR
jgi:hypothetical protein